MLNEIKYSIRAIVLFTIMLGLIYPLLILVIGQAAFPNQANGSIIELNGRKVGSGLIGQNFKRPEYFHPRPSYAGNDGYDASSSGGSNLGPTNKKLLDAVNLRKQTILADNPGINAGSIPIDALTSSASGLDPHISVENAEMQAERVAKARGADLANIRKMIEKHTAKPIGIIPGEAAVNVLLLNLELDQLGNRR